MPFADLGGHAAHYRLAGTPGAPRLVFANSLGSDLRIWDEVTAALAPDFAILGYDMRGHGLSGLGAEAPSIADLADDLLKLMDVVGWPSAALVGVSVGGLVAQAVALAAPTHVDALVLMDTAARIGSRQSWNERIAAVETGGLPAIAETVATRWFSAGFAARRPAEFTGWRTMLERIPAAGYADICRALREADLTEAVGAITVPTLVLCGEEDVPTPPALARATAERIPGARFTLIEKAGHIPGLEHPRAVADLVRAHWKEVAHGR
ncbi:3-oxoadipate enol-lactonase [Aureimonas sp. AU12]|uniref:3-oxoadipate enol-lactonase n=1 Tax=Aureimonas sp. AU12 TaxID=1638161 RepID=UPI000784AE68|nr:3-oxoadipate enol-lactonase [Aureimonas sp. AU12]